MSQNEALRILFSVVNIHYETERESVLMATMPLVTVASETCGELNRICGVVTVTFPGTTNAWESSNPTRIAFESRLHGPAIGRLLAWAALGDVRTSSEGRGSPWTPIMAMHQTVVCCPTVPELLRG